LDGARSWKEVIRDRITDGTQAQFVAAFALLEERHNPLCALPLGFVEINPGER
jgi:hypothetical protein